jgi:hypothetical protein
MSVPDGPQLRPISIAECAICSRLGDVERSYSKWGREEQTLPFPDAVRALVSLEDPAEAESGEAASGESVCRCPQCGTCHRYSWSSEYLANGSEERGELRRLAPAQARVWLDDTEYAWLMGWMGLWVSHADPAVRRHASRALTANHCAAGDVGVVGALLRGTDEEIVRGALYPLRDAWKDKEWDPDLRPAASALVALEHSPDAEISSAARYLVQACPTGNEPAPPVSRAP